MRGRSGEAARLLRLGLASIVLTLAPAGIHAAGPLGADQHPGSAPPWAGRTCQEPTPRYPESRSLNDDAVSIAKVRIGNQRFESGHGGDGYQDHTRRTFTLHSGAREYLSLHPWYGVAEELTVYWLVWIDLNCDGDFDDTVAGA
ncbi:MAG: hypothetical protein ACE5EL_02130, partial [Anaerolineae bacterium]